MWVRKRDGNRCIITGSTTDPLVTTWIVPPFFTSVDYDGPVSFTPPPASENIYLKVNNGLTMRQDVADLFSNNDIAIDVDDNFRVVFMQEPSKLCSKKLLAMIPSHISLPRGIQEELWVDLRMLRWHLRYTLLANGAADDVTLYYGQGKMAAVIDKLTGEDEGGDEVEDMEDLDNELWKSPIGQIYFAWLVFTKGMKD
ncbi:hypothetical protein A0H81_07548 [Grifola frondosa]|uniref:HNH nuclease domain-containing protein n=1 Tax=Grifola frondosa TaxID=5627 RepID=A0A1C7M654_GRIFR|nr:hypothetical protein A0H81_07548 [Grifola frondosa]